MSFLENAVERFDNYVKDNYDSTASLWAHGAHGILAPATLIDAALKTLIGLGATFVSLITLTSVKPINQFTLRYLRASGNIVSFPYRNYIKAVYPQAKFPTSASGTVREYVLLLSKGVDRIYTEGDSFLEKHVASRVCLVMIALAFVVANVADATFGVIALTVSIGTLGYFNKINQAAFHHLSAVIVLADLLEVAIKILNPGAFNSVEPQPKPKTPEKPEDLSEKSEEKQVENPKKSPPVVDLNEALAIYTGKKTISFSTYPCVGIPNYFRNNCFFNATLQVLTHSRILDYALYYEIPKPTFDAKIDFDEKFLKEKPLEPKRQEIEKKEEITFPKFQKFPKEPLPANFRGRSEDYWKAVEDYKTAKKDYDSYDRLWKSCKAKEERIDREYQKRLQQVEAEYQEECHKYSNLTTRIWNYERACQKYKEECENYEKHIQFQSLFRGTIEELRNGKAPSEKTVRSLFMHLGYPEGSQGDPANLVPHICEFLGINPYWSSTSNVLQGPSVDNVLTPDMTTILQQTAAVTYGSGSHVWAIVRREDGSWKEINDSCVSSFTSENLRSEYGMQVFRPYSDKR